MDGQRHYPEKASAAVERERRRRVERERRAVELRILNSLGRDADPFPPRRWNDEAECWETP